MSYLNDPRVFLATERTLLAWIRTEVSMMALIFLLKQFGLEHMSTQYFSVDAAIHIICYTVIGLSVMATVQAWLTISKLSDVEIPNKIAKHLILFSGLVSILLCVGASFIVLTI